MNIDARTVIKKQSFDTTHYFIVQVAGLITLLRGENDHENHNNHARV